MKMDTIKVKVLHYYNHPVLYAFMPQPLFESLEEAFLHNDEMAIVPRKEFDRMIRAYFETLKN